VLDRISSTIKPAIHIVRNLPCTQLLSILEQYQAVIVTGPAGSGKSAISKDVLETLRRDNFIIAFRAEEFATVHLDETLLRGQIPSTAIKLSSLLALHSKKLILVESVERLLEKNERTAFFDLLHMIQNDNTWELILTCRDYSLDLVQTAFLEDLGISYTVLRVPLFDEFELDQVISEIPKLKRPSKNPALRKAFPQPLHFR
jgi:tRNA A37 threonylcarbamoyladenosine biosynthesis protein TsaE